MRWSATRCSTLALVATALLVLTACSDSDTAAADQPSSDAAVARGGAEEPPEPFVGFSLDRLKQAFNDSEGQPRLILLVDPI